MAILWAILLTCLVYMYGMWVKSFKYLCIFLVASYRDIMAMGDRVHFIGISLMRKSSNKTSASKLPDLSAILLGWQSHPSIMGGWLQSVWSPRSTGISFTTIKHRLHNTTGNIDMSMCHWLRKWNFMTFLHIFYLIKPSFKEGEGF